MNLTRLLQNHNSKTSISKLIDGKRFDCIEYSANILACDPQLRIDEAYKSKKELGHDDLSFDMLLKLSLDELSNEESQKLVLAKGFAQDAIYILERTLTEDELLSDVNKDKGTKATIEPVIRRIQYLQNIDFFSADKLESKLIVITKNHGIKDKTIKASIYPKIAANEDQQFQQVKLPFQVIGTSPDSKILIWHKGHLKHVPVSQLKEDDLELSIKPPFDAIAVKAQIIRTAREKGIINQQDPFKTGLWKTDRGWLLISGKKFVLIGHDKNITLEDPVFQDRIILLEDTIDWVDIDKVRPDKSLLKQTFNEILQIVEQWNWLDDGMAEYITAFLMLTPFQEQMDWRPWLFLTGHSGCGKSAFWDDVLVPIYGILVARIDNATPHAPIQAVAGSTRILVLDEFEKNKNVPTILNNLKPTGRGGPHAKGTLGEKVKYFNLHHMPWFACIFLPPSLYHDESKRNRTIRFEINKKQKGKPLTHVLTKAESKAICPRIISSMIPIWDEIQEKAEHIFKRTKKIVNDLDKQIVPRTVENFMYASALLNIITGEDHTVPLWGKIGSEDDGQTLIRTILYTKIRYNLGEYLVIDLIKVLIGEPAEHPSLKENLAKDALRLHGITTVQPKAFPNTWYIAFLPDQIRKTLLKNDEDYGKVDIEAPLERINGSIKNAKTAWGSKETTEGKKRILERCIHIPANIVLEKETSQ